MITSTQDTHPPAAVPHWLQLGFRPFFIGAAVFAVASMVLWLAALSGGLELGGAGLSAYQWHGHEMVFGYGMAVVAGFVLTAARNWSGLQTTYGNALLALFGAWAGARLAFAAGALELAATADTAFSLSLCAALAAPILRRRLWAQLPILVFVACLAAANVVFYAGALGWLAGASSWGNSAGLYLTLGLILVMGRRVVPFFIERGVGPGVTLRQSPALDRAIALLFVVYAAANLSTSLNAGATQVAQWTALALALTTAVRLQGWHTARLWRKPLLWSLYLSLWGISAGFALHAVAPLLGASPYLALHAFAYLGIGLVTLSMMARVSLGHTGRDVQAPPAGTGLALALLLLGGVARALVPLALPAHYLALLAISQWLWIAAFSLFAWRYIPYLCRPRVDGQFG